MAEGDLHSPTFMMRLVESIKRPFILTANEVIIVFVCFYQTVIAIILFTFIDGFDNIFRQVYDVSIVSTAILTKEYLLILKPFRELTVLCLWG